MGRMLEAAIHAARLRALSGFIAAATGPPTPAPRVVPIAANYDQFAGLIKGFCQQITQPIKSSKRLMMNSTRVMEH